MTFAIDDEVRLAPGYGSAAQRRTTFKVVAINPKAPKNKYTVEPVSGGPRRRGPADAFEPAAAPRAQVVDYLTPLDCGQVVTVSGIAKIDARHRFVVLKQKDEERVSIVKLGGDGGRYWPSIPRACVERRSSDSDPLRPRRSAGVE